MKLVRYKKNNTPYPGIVSDEGKIYDLSSHINDISDYNLSSTKLSELSKVNIDNLPLISKYDKLLPCVGNVGKIICVGLNYLDHIKETNAIIPKEPVIFSKLCLPTGAYDNIIIPKGSYHTDWEVELAIVIGSQCKHVAQEEAFNYIAGYCIINDLSERKFQLEHEGQWVKGKSCESFAPLGPWLVTQDEIPNIQNLNLYTKIDSRLYQNSNTNQMLFTVDYLVSYLSKFMILYPGDIISTGTPPGVGLGFKPSPIYLKPGQHVEIGIEGLGKQECKTIEYQDTNE